MLRTLIGGNGFTGPNQNLDQSNPEELQKCNDGNRNKKGDKGGDHSSVEGEPPEAYLGQDEADISSYPLARYQILTRVSWASISCAMMALAFFAGRRSNVSE